MSIVDMCSCLISPQLEFIMRTLWLKHTFFLIDLLLTSRISSQTARTEANATPTTRIRNTPPTLWVPSGSAAGIVSSFCKWDHVHQDGDCECFKTFTGTKVFSPHILHRLVYASTIVPSDFWGNQCLEVPKRRHPERRGTLNLYD